MSTPTNALEARDAAECPPLDGPGLFADRIAAEFSYSLRHGVPLSLIVIEPPSEALTDPRWRSCVRASDVIARIDRRRIAVIAPHTSPNLARSIAVRLREFTEGMARVGLVTLSPRVPFDGPGAMLRAAELALE